MARVVDTIINLKDKFSGTLNKISKNTEKFQAQMKQAELSGNKLRKSMGNTFGTIAKTAGVVGVASVTAFGAASVKTFADFEQSMSNVESLLGSSATPEIMTKLGDKAEELGRKTSKSAKECADAMSYQALAGFSVNDILKSTEPILRLSEAASLDLARTSDLVTDSLSAMGLTTDDLGKYLDVVATTQAAANTSAEGMLEAYIAVGGQFKNLNVTLEESASMIGILANRGVKSSEAGNALNAILINLTSGAGQAGEAMKKIGVSAYDAQGKFKGIEKVLLEVKAATKDYTDAQRDQIYSMIAGKTQMTAFNALMSGVSEEYKDLKESVSDCGGALEKMAQTKQDNLIGRLTQIKSGIEGIQIRLIKQFKPQLTGFLDYILATLPKVSDYIANKVEWFAKQLPKLGAIISALIPVIGGVVGGLMAFSVLTKVISMFNKFKRTVLGLKTTLLALSANPVFLIAAALGVLAVAFIGLYQHCEGFRNAINGMMTKLQEFGSYAMAVLQPVFDWIGSWVTGTLIPIFTQLGAKIMEIWTNSIAPALAKLSQNLLILWNNVLSPLLGFLGGAFLIGFMSCFDTIANLFSTFLTTVTGVVSSVINIFSSIIDFIVNVFTGNWSAAWQNIVNILINLLNGMQSVVKGIFNGIIDLVNGIIGGINKVTSIEIGGKSIGFTIPTIPKFATGTQYFKGGVAEIGEHGGEIVNLPNGSQVIPADKSEKMLSGGGNVNINLTIQGNVIGNDDFANDVGSTIVKKIKDELNRR